ncbi:MAG: hypothetical protein V2I33_24160 [Kangiellaceae bacterium]|nr:hypothetical protein [Kangiellaceae bacterium]
MEDELEFKNKEINAIQTRLVDSEKALDNVQVVKSGAPQNSLEVEQLKADN